MAKGIMRSQIFFEEAIHTFSSTKKALPSAATLEDCQVKESG